MTKRPSDSTSRPANHVRMPANSFLYERVVPAMLLILAVVMVVILLVAFGVLVGIIPYR